MSSDLASRAPLSSGSLFFYLTTLEQLLPTGLQCHSSSSAAHPDDTLSFPLPLLLAGRKCLPSDLPYHVSPPRPAGTVVAAPL